MNLHAPWGYLCWAIRHLLWGNPLFKTIDEWYPPESEDIAIVRAHQARFLKCWEYLRPFFASRGYLLYDYGPRQGANYPPTQAITPPPGGVYPYGRRFYTEREDGKFITPSSLRLWAARDMQGHDVVIKIVPRSELDVLLYLNTKEARSDPRNHTIPLVDYGTVSGYSFIITPRWDCAFRYRFKTVAELMHMTKELLEGMDFFHENRVFHADFLEQNVGMNVVLHLPHGTKQPLGLRDPSSTQYAFYDFENSAVYPLDAPLEDIQETKYAGFRLRGIKDPKGPYKPFPLDVLGLGLVLERRTRHIVNIVPELGPFLDRMITLDEAERFTARQSLNEFKRIYSNLTTDQLSQVLRTWLWNKKRGAMSVNSDEI